MAVASAAMVSACRLIGCQRAGGPSAAGRWGSASARETTEPKIDMMEKLASRVSGDVRISSAGGGPRVAAGERTGRCSSADPTIASRDGSRDEHRSAGRGLRDVRSTSARNEPAKSIVVSDQDDVEQSQTVGKPAGMTEFISAPTVDRRIVPHGPGFFSRGSRGRSYSQNDLRPTRVSTGPDRLKGTNECETPATMRWVTKPG